MGSQSLSERRNPFEYSSNLRALLSQIDKSVPIVKNHRGRDA
jgi:hypothetical protein